MTKSYKERLYKQLEISVLGSKPSGYSDEFLQDDPGYALQLMRACHRRARELRREIRLNEHLGRF